MFYRSTETACCQNSTPTQTRVSHTRNGRISPRVVRRTIRQDWLTHEKKEEHPKELCSRGPRQIFGYVLAKAGGLTSRHILPKNDAQLQFALERHL